MNGNGSKSRNSNRNRKLWFVVLTLTVAALICFCGCGGNKDQSAQTTTATTAKTNDTTAPASQRGGTPSGQAPGDDAQMIVGIPSLTPSFDYFNTVNGYETFSVAQVYDTLLVKDDAGDYVCSLAERYEISSDALVFTFYIHPDAKWTDGTPVTASDVKFSMDQLLVSAYTSWIYEPLLESVNVLDEKTVEIILKKSSVSLLEYLSNPYYCSILSEKAYEQYGDAYGDSVDAIVSSGPYKVTAWSVGESITYEANPDYYLDAPSIKNVKLVSMSDSNTAMFAMQTGELDAFLSDVPGVSYDTVSSAENISLVDYTATILYCAFFNSQNGLFSDVRMRQAVALAMNKEDYILIGAEGFGVPADYPGDRGVGATTGDPALHGIWDNIYAYDPDAAMSLVEECGNTGKSVVIKTYSTDPYPALATVLQNALNEIGLNASIEQIERATFISQVLAEADFEIQICRWAAGTEDMDEIIYGSLHTDSIGSPGNWSFYGNPDLDVLIEEAASELDNGERQGLYEKIIELYLDEAVYIPIYYPTSSRAFSNRVAIDEGYVKYDKFINYRWR